MTKASDYYLFHRKYSGYNFLHTATGRIYKKAPFFEKFGKLIPRMMESETPIAPEGFELIKNK